MLGRFVGIPFVSKGRDWSGCDCWGLLRLVYQEELGITLPSYADRYRDTRDGEAISLLVMDTLQAGIWREVESPDPFDAVVLNIQGQPWHIGIMVDSGRMLHCTHGVDACIEPLQSVLWSRRIEGYFRHVG